LTALGFEISNESIDAGIIPDTGVAYDRRYRSVPERNVENALGLSIASRRGEFARVDTTLESLLGRHPIFMRDVIAEKFAASR
jgi:NAD(P)H dehydrogenase (quinone)